METNSNYVINLFFSENYKIGNTNIKLNEFICNHEDFDEVSKLTFNTDYELFIGETKLEKEDLNLTLSQLKTKFNVTSDKLSIKIVSDITQRLSDINEISNTLNSNTLKYFEFRKTLTDYGTVITDNSEMKEKLITKVKSLIKPTTRLEEFMKEIEENNYDDLKSKDDFINHLRKRYKEFFGANQTKSNEESLLTKKASKIDSDQISISKCEFCYNSFIIAKILIKVVHRITRYDEMFKTSDPLSNISKLKFSDLTPYYIKVTDLLLEDVYTFLYKYGTLFFANKKAIAMFYEIKCNMLISIVEKFNTHLLLIMNKKDKQNIKSNTEVLNGIAASIIETKAYMYMSGAPTKLIYFSVEKPVNVYYSEKTYNEIMSILKITTHPETFRKNCEGESESEKELKYFISIFERDVRIFDYYGVKFEDLNIGYLLYDN